MIIPETVRYNVDPTLFKKKILAVSCEPNQNRH